MPPRGEVEQQLKTVTQHKDGALRELEKVQKQLYAEQDKNADLANAMQEQKHTEIQGAWAIDRAIEVAKLRIQGEPPIDILETAQKYCAWIKSTSAKPYVKPDQETMQ